MRIPRFVRAAVVAVAIAAALGTPTASAGDIVIRRDGSKAVDVPVPPAPMSPDTADGFHLYDAGLGAAGMLALVLGSAAVIIGRRRPRSEWRVS